MACLCVCGGGGGGEDLCVCLSVCSQPVRFELADCTGDNLYLNLFRTHFIVLKLRADKSSLNSFYSEWEELAEIERAFRKTARSEISEREGTGRPIILMLCL